MDQVEKLSRAMTAGDPDRLMPISYDEWVGKSDIGGAPKTLRRTDMIPTWKFHEAAARAALSRLAAMDGEVNRR